MTQPRTLTELLALRAALTPDKMAVLAGDRRLTYADLAEQSARLALWLRAAGVVPGARVAYLDRNSPDFFILLFAVSRLRGVLVPLSWRLTPAEVVDLVVDSTAVVAVVGSTFADVAEALPSDLHVLEAGAAGEAPDRAGGLPPAADIDAVDVVLQMYSSGTTGTPKGVLLSHRNLLAKFLATPPVWGLGPDSVSLAAMPLFHIGGAGWALGALYHGGSIVVRSRVDAADLLGVVSEEAITHAFFVPAVLGQLVELARGQPARTSRLRMVVYGASPIEPEVLAGAMALFGCPFQQAYGLTEASGQVVTLTHEEHLECLHAVAPLPTGRPDPGIELRVCSIGTTTEVGVGEPGEVHVRGAQVMTGYWRRPAETAAVLSPEGWLRTGDIGILDAEGLLHLVDRVTDMIVSGGENVYPAEIEAVLRRHPGVVEVAVVGVPSTRWGETPHAFVVPASSGSTAAELTMFCREHLAGYKCPSSIVFVDELPRNATGKVLKRELRSTPAG